MGNSSLWRVGLIWSVSAGLILLVLLFGRLLPGAQIAYTSQYPGSEHIHLLDVTRGFRFLLAVGELPLWSPDGTQLAYIHNGAANQNIFVTNFNAGGANDLIAGRPGKIRPVWSPDGTQLAFVSIRNNNWEVFVTDVCHEANCDPKPRNLTQDATVDTSPSWSPDGQRIAFLSGRTGKIEIYTMQPDGNDMRRLTQNAVTDLNAPQWSPDSSQLAFVSVRGGNLDIYVMDSTCGDLPDGCEGHVRNLTRHTAMDMNPSWSPDGRQIAFTSRRDNNFEIYVVSAAGGEPRNLTNFPAEDRSPVWSPDGRWIAFQSNRDKLFNDEIYLLDVATGEQRRLTVSFGSSQSPVWWSG
jgi:Tol biopolymer transport system component